MAPALPYEGTGPPCPRTARNSSSVGIWSPTRPPSTYEATIRLGMEDPRIHALVLGYWHTIVTPSMVFAELTARVVAEFRERGIEKPVVALLAGDTEVEEACQYLFEHGVVAYPYTTEKPVAVLGAKYRWARAAGLLDGDR